MAQPAFDALAALEHYTGQENTPERVKLPAEGENAVQGKFAPSESVRHYTRLEAEQKRNSAYAAMFKEYQDNIKRAGQLMAEINKGVNAGADMATLLLKAIEAISRMTGNKLFYEQNRAKIEQLQDNKKK